MVATAHRPPAGTKLYDEAGNFWMASKAATYRTTQSPDQTTGSLIDGGCNGGLAGSDVIVLEESLEKVNVKGIADTTLKSVPVGTVAGLITTTKGPVIGIFHQYACHGKGSTIHSVNQFRSFGLEVNDIPKSCPGGGQAIKTPEGHIIPLAVRDGLCYMDMRPPTQAEMDQLPHVILTSDKSWDPNSLDSEPEGDEFFEAQAEEEEDVWVDCDDDYGEHFEEHELNIFQCLQANNTGTVRPPRKILPAKPNFESLRPYFGWVSAERVKATLENTTQWFRASCRMPMRRHYKTRFPAANVNRWNEDVATDTLFSDTPAADDGIMGHAGCTMAQLYTGLTSHYTKVYPMASESQIPSTLQDLIRDRGAPNNIKSDCAKAVLGKNFTEVLRHYCIGHKMSEPYQQNQNPAERRIQDVKARTNTIMDRTGTPPQYWLLCLLYVTQLLNILSLESLNQATPTQLACGFLPDVSAFLHFKWWEPVYYLDDDGSFPSDSKEKLGRWVGIAENVGDVLTWLILTEDTKRVIPRSVIRTANNSKELNLRAQQIQDDPLEILEGPEPGSINISNLYPNTSQPSTAFQNLYSVQDQLPENETVHRLPQFSIEELIGRTFLLDHENGQRLRAEIIRKIDDQDARNHTNIKLLCKVGDDEAEEILGYQELCDLIAEQDEAELDGNKLWTFKRVLEHVGPLNSSSPEWKGSKL